jgi:hypothetical protein
MRKVMMALLAAASLAVLTPTMASAHGPGFHGHGFHGGFHHGFGPRFGFGFGPYVGYPYYYGGPSYYADIEPEGGCYVTRKRVHTPRGWRVRKVEVCE